MNSTDVKVEEFAVVISMMTRFQEVSICSVRQCADEDGAGLVIRHGASLGPLAQMDQKALNQLPDFPVLVVGKEWKARSSAGFAKVFCGLGPNRQVVGWLSPNHKGFKLRNPIPAFCLKGNLRILKVHANSNPDCARAAVVGIETLSKIHSGRVFLAEGQSDATFAVEIVPATDQAWEWEPEFSDRFKTGDLSEDARLERVYSLFETSQSIAWIRGVSGQCFSGIIDWLNQFSFSGLFSEETDCVGADFLRKCFAENPAECRKQFLAFEKAARKGNAQPEAKTWVAFFSEENQYASVEDMAADEILERQKEICRQDESFIFLGEFPSRKAAETAVTERHQQTM